MLGCLENKNARLPTFLSAAECSQLVLSRGVSWYSFDHTTIALIAFYVIGKA